MCIEAATMPPMTGDFGKPLAVGPVALPNRVFLAPMSGVTDAPFRRLAARLGAGVVVSEMIASDALAEGRRDAAAPARRRGAAASTSCSSPAARRAGWPKARASREAAGADIIDINMGCPAKHVTGEQSGSALMRDLDHALTLIDATVGAVSGAGHAEDAARLGRRLAQRAGARAPRRSGRHAAHHRARPHALPVLQGLGRLGRDPRREAGGVDPGRRQWRRDELRGAPSRRSRVRRGRRDGRARRATAGRGFPDSSRTIWRPAKQRAAPSLDRAVRARQRRSTTRC